MSQPSRCWFSLCMLLQLCAQLIWQLDASCMVSELLPHGSYRIRRNMVRVTCNRGYELQGPRFYQCVSGNGRLLGEPPVCAKSGCRPLVQPTLGQIIATEIRSMISCDDGFVVAGNTYTICTGDSWDRPLGTCRPLNHTNNHACDFESEDLCGWTAGQLFSATWRRVATINHFKIHVTGPYHDHTHQHARDGHYMLMETIMPSLMPQLLTSPIYPRALSLKTACCFRFHYFMYGEHVGKLQVLVYPRLMPFRVVDLDRYKILEISGNQGREWLERTISIDEMPSDFQIIFSAHTTFEMGFGDIAVDDVQLMTGTDCDPHATTAVENSSWGYEATEPVAFAMESCAKRCGEAASAADKLTADGKLIKSCGCHDLCGEQENCCLDYIQMCAEDDKTTDEQPATTTIMLRPMPNTPASTMTIPTTTTTKRPTTTSTTTTTTTTTTRKPPTTTTARRPTTITTIPTTTKKTTTAQPTSRTTATTTTTTTTKTTTARATTRSSTAAITIKTTTAQKSSNASTPIRKNSTRLHWKIDAKQLDGGLSDNESHSGSRIMLFTLLSLMAIIVVIVTVRNRLHNTETNVSVVSYKPNLAQRWKKNANNVLLKVRQVRRKNVDTDGELLCNALENDQDDDGFVNAAVGAPNDSVIYEELGNDAIQMDDAPKTS